MPRCTPEPRTTAILGAIAVGLLLAPALPSPATAAEPRSKTKTRSAAEKKKGDEVRKSTDRLRKRARPKGPGRDAKLPVAERPGPGDAGGLTLQDVSGDVFADRNPPEVRITAEVAGGTPTHFRAAEAPTLSGRPWQPWPADGRPRMAVSPGDGARSLRFQVRGATPLGVGPGGNAVQVESGVVTVPFALPRVAEFTDRGEVPPGRNPGWRATFEDLPGSALAGATIYDTSESCEYTTEDLTRFGAFREGRLTLEWDARIEGSGSCPLMANVAVTGASGGPQTLHFELGTVDLLEWELLRFEHTGALRHLLGFRSTLKPKAAGLVDVGACSGNHFGTPVGMRVEDGDLVFRVRSGLHPGECEWRSRCRYTRKNARVQRLHFETRTSGPDCIVSENGESLNGAELPPDEAPYPTFASDGDFDTNGGSWPDVTVKLSCRPDPTHGSEAEVRLAFVEVEGPPASSLEEVVSDRGHPACSR